MAGRKPPGVSFETWVDRQIREGLAKGAFDDLPRVPLDLSEDTGDDWWIKKKIRDDIEGLKDHVGVTAVYTYSPTDHFGAQASSVVLLSVKDGKFVIAK